MYDLFQKAINIYIVVTKSVSGTFKKVKNALSRHDDPKL